MDDRLKHSFRMSVLLGTSLAVSVPLYGVVVFVALTQPGVTPAATLQSVRITLAIFGVAAIALSRLMRRLILSPASSALPEATRLLAGDFVAMAISEIPALIGLAAAFFFTEKSLFYLPAALSLLAFMINFPRLTTWEQDLRSF